ncbi:MAG: hypothetical protein EHM28_06275 [Spirochaetaceae bacterium]|nr:MAG: hypothetical protein EHM28_06275 [Spirochaetaceae bacterium]
MADDLLSVAQADFGGSKGDVLIFDLAAAKNDFAYAGLWYACDKSEDTLITTSFYYGNVSPDSMPEKPALEIAENSFKRSPRQQMDRKQDRILISGRHDKGGLCRLQASPWIEEKSFINYKVIRNKGANSDTLGSGLLRGDGAKFCKIGVEDNSGALDYNDTIWFLVLIRSLPPDNWKFDPAFFGVQKLPMTVPTFIFSVTGSKTTGLYSPWLGQNPMEGCI